jgi:FKBP-type peptidyl-prolyl cis-trans isomerase 2
MIGCFTFTSVGFSYSVQPWDNALLTKIYDRIDEVYKNDHTKLLTFSDAVFSQELRFAKTDQSKYFFWKIKEYINGKLYSFVESPEFVCLQERVQYGDATTITYRLQFDKWFVQLPNGAITQTPSEKALLFNAGKWQVIAWIDQAVLWDISWKNYGVVVEPRQWRWNIQNSLIIEYPTALLIQKYQTIFIGDGVQLRLELDGIESQVVWRVLSIDAESTMIDLNHPLAWETLLGVYTIENVFKDCR